MNNFVDSFDTLNVVIEKEDVISGNIEPYINILNGLLTSKEKVISYYEKVDISINGYNDTTEELFEIVEVRNFIYKLDEVFPYWLFFLSKNFLGLQMIAFCFLPPFLTESAKNEIYPQKLLDLLTNRWFLAMNQLFDYVEFSNEENIEITDRTYRYFFGNEYKN